VNPILRTTVVASVFVLVAVPLLAATASASTPLPGQANCSTSASTNPRPSAWYSLGKPANYFDDGCFHQFMVNNPDTPSIDVLIIPPPGATALRDANMLRASVHMWETGLKEGAHTSGMDWLRDGIRITPFVLGEDVPAVPAALAPEIVVVLQDAGPLGVAWAFAGVGIDGPLNFCHPVAAATAGTFPTADQIRAQPGFDGHDGHGWGNLQASCDGQRTCLVVGAVAYDLPTDFQAMNLYDLMSHEFGHCLGLGHVGDASDFASLAYPPDDIMSYAQDGHQPAYDLCVSNLDLKTFAYRYQPLIPGASALGYSADSAGYIEMQGGANPINADNTAVQDPLPASSWRIVKSDGTLSTTAADCPQPDRSLIQLPPIPGQVNGATAPAAEIPASPAAPLALGMASVQPASPLPLALGLVALVGLVAAFLARRANA
jgi:hypothetical protein